MHASDVLSFSFCCFPLSFCVQFYIDRIFGGAEALKMLILTDFFRHAFDGQTADSQKQRRKTKSVLSFVRISLSLLAITCVATGSGAENFFDAGSCIDGRLTSAWNWCNKLEKKSYYTIFQLSGFSSFDGQWSD